MSIHVFRIARDYFAEQSAEHAKALAAAVAAEREACAVAALAAGLPEGFQWGRDAMEQFDFGKKRSADAIRARTKP